MRMLGWRAAVVCCCDRRMLCSLLWCQLSALCSTDAVVAVGAAAPAHVPMQARARPKVSITTLLSFPFSRSTVSRVVAIHLFRLLCLLSVFPCCCYCCCCCCAHQPHKQVRKAFKDKDWVLRKKEAQRKKGLDVRPNSKYTARRRPHLT